MTKETKEGMMQRMVGKGKAGEIMNQRLRASSPAF